MIIRVRDAIRDALARIQELGYIVLARQNSNSLEIIWPGEGTPPNIDDMLDVLQMDPTVLNKILKNRTISVPLWILFGYPWDRPALYWQKLRAAFSPSPQPLQAKKRAYAEACLAFYKDKQDLSWRTILWEEPWPMFQS